MKRLPDASLHLAYVISPHGFGHATRAVAILEALFELEPKAQVTICSTVPHFLFDALPQERIHFESIACDIGLVQASPTEVNLLASKTALEAFWPPETMIDTLAELLKQRHCDGVVCDIAPMAILAAKKAGLPSILVENFTWDWIYAGIPGGLQHLAPMIEAFRNVFAMADVHLQVSPVCHPRTGARTTDFVVRTLRESRQALRLKLGISPNETLVLVTMGGLAGNPEFVEYLEDEERMTFLIPGLSNRRKHVIGLGKPDQFYHPDWVQAADLVVGKLGYSTVAEVIQAGTPMAFVDRPNFPESAVLAKYLGQKVPVKKLEGFANGTWIQEIASFMPCERVSPCKSFGARQVAQGILAAKAY